MLRVLLRINAALEDHWCWCVATVLLTPGRALLQDMHARKGLQRAGRTAFMTGKLHGCTCKGRLPRRLCRMLLLAHAGTVTICTSRGLRSRKVCEKVCGWVGVRVYVCVCVCVNRRYMYSTRQHLVKRCIQLLQARL